jgi:tRNA(Ile)-lysidine synthase
LESYLSEIAQDWREDSSNRDLRHARNRVRHGILPRLERGLNPAVRETLAETAEIARSEEEYWQKEVARVLPEVWGADQRILRLAELSRLPLALRRRLIRAAAESLGLRLEFRHVEEILALGRVTGKSAMLPKAWTISRFKDELRFDLPGKEAAIVSNYEYALAVPGLVRVAEAKTWFEAALVPGSGAPGYNPDHMFDPALLRSELTVRNWRPGDRFWPAHRKSPKKIKELLQERKVTGTERKLWPVVASGEHIVWVRGFLAPLQLRPANGSKQALVIREVGSTQTHD